MKHFSLLPALLFLVSCSTTDHVGPTEHWSYRGDTGPAQWSKLSPEWQLASKGTQQSPVDLSNARASRGLSSEAGKLDFHYRPFPLDMINNGHTIQINASGSNWVMIGEDRYDLLQFHFHAPSEHTIDGRHSAMEVHLVHRNGEGELAVVGVLIDAGTDHDQLTQLWKQIPQGAGDRSRDSDLQVDASALLPDSFASYRYQGSLTTPPCSEGVRWVVLRTVEEASTEQIRAFSRLFGDNNRPVQPLHDRQVRVVD